MPHEVVLGFLEHAEELLASGPFRQAVLAFSAGSFIAFGAVLSVALTTDVEPIGISRLLLGLGFAAGFVMVILSGSALFTEINVLLPEMFLIETSSSQGVLFQLAEGEESSRDRRPTRIFVLAPNSVCSKLPRGVPNWGFY